MRVAASAPPSRAARTSRDRPATTAGTRC
jgi:hypothetical protein